MKIFPVIFYRQNVYFFPLLVSLSVYFRAEDPWNGNWKNFYYVIKKQLRLIFKGCGRSDLIYPCFPFVPSYFCRVVKFLAQSRCASGYNHPGQCRPGKWWNLCNTAQVSFHRKLRGKQTMILWLICRLKEMGGELIFETVAVWWVDGARGFPERILNLFVP